MPPTTKLLFDTSPLVATVERRDKRFYRFATTTCAIVGGVFTVLKVIANVVEACRQPCGGGRREEGEGEGAEAARE